MALHDWRADTLKIFGPRVISAVIVDALQPLRPGISGNLGAKAPNRKVSKPPALSAGASSCQTVYGFLPHLLVIILSGYLQCSS